MRRRQQPYHQGDQPPGKDGFQEHRAEFRLKGLFPDHQKALPDGCIHEAALRQYSSDENRARDAALSADGYHVLRFWNSEILTNEEGVLAVILAKLEEATL